jgi:transmembrane sensor
MAGLSKIFEIARLITKEKIDKLSDSESKILQYWLAENDNNKSIYKKLQDEQNLVNEINELKKFDEINAFQKVQQKITTQKIQPKVFRIVPNFVKYAAAAAALVVGSYFILTKINKHEIVHYEASTIMPGKQKAILITSGNMQIVLDSSNKEEILRDGLTNIIHTGSTLSYNKSDTIDNVKNVTEYNTLITPRGGEYTLFLSDGTEVILNSGSKLKYPVIFNHKNREVELEGEAFFRVTKSKESPFIVKTNNVNVTVYGTIFNVSAYNNENLMQTTLIEGSVGVSLNDSQSESEVKIEPGQQLIYNKGSGNTETKEVDTEQFIAWTKGMFVFENEPIENILKIMSRWYDFNFEFKDSGLKNQRFTLSLGRNEEINKILEMISSSSNLKFSTRGNSIIVYTD